MLNILNVAQTGLQVSQTQVENVMNNLANQNTEGYTKRVVNTSELEQIDARLTGRGVSTDSVTRVTDTYMYDKLVQEEAKLSNITTLNSMLNSIESIFYETDDTGLSADLDRYFNSMENLKTSPDSDIYKTDLSSNATILVQNMQDLYKNIEELEASTIDEAYVVVDEVNALLKSLGEVSKNILESTGSKNDLYDKRDLLEKELSQYIDIDVTREPDYQIQIDGVTAVRFNTNVQDIKLVENYIPQADAFVAIDTNGNIKLDSDGNPYSNIVDPQTWGTDIDLTTSSNKEVQHIPLSGGLPTAAGQELEILGHTITGIDNSLGDYDSGDASKLEDLINNVILANTDVMDAWNLRPENANKQIDSISAGKSNPLGTVDMLVITYADDAITADVPTIEASNSNGLFMEKSIEIERGGETSSKSEVQTIQLSGTTSQDDAYFLGTPITGSLAGESYITTATKIAANPNDIISNWNSDPDNAEQQIESITADTNGKLTITYKPHMGDVSIMEETSSRGITYDKSVEVTKGAPEDTLSYTLNNEFTVTVTNGETIYEADGVTPADINGDGTVDQNDIVDNTNTVQALVYKINQNYEMSQKIEAYNGKYELDEEGNKILTNNPLHSDYDPLDPNKERYLFVESTIDGEAGSFTGEIVVNDSANVDPETGNYKGVTVSHENRLSVEGIDDIHLEIFDEPINISGGGLNAMLNNLKTDSGNNSFGEYKEMLDNFAQKLSDYSSDFIETADGEYVYGTNAMKTDGSGIEATHLGLFTGSDVKTLQFDKDSVNNLTQNKLDYLVTIQWKDDIDFSGEGIDTSSFSEYYQSLRFNIANTREDVIFDQESQEAINESIQNTYDKLTKVDSDEEMVALIKFQSAYSANAKMITAADEMLQTLLNM